MKLFIAPHNDDETLFGAFTIQRERPLVVVVFDSHVQVNRGNPISAAATFLAGMDPADYATGLISAWEVRRCETIKALVALGLLGDRLVGARLEDLKLDESMVKFLGFRDDDPPAAQAIADAIEPLTRPAWIPEHRVYDPEMPVGRVAKVGPAWDELTDIWAPAWEEGGHEQHNLVAQAAKLIAPGVKHHSYMTYTRALGKSRGFEVRPESADHIANKLRAMACYRSQMERGIGCAEWFYAHDLREYVQ